MKKRLEIKQLKQLRTYLLDYSYERHDGETDDEDLSDAIWWLNRHVSLRDKLGVATPKQIYEYHQRHHYSQSDPIMHGELFCKWNPDTCGCTYDGFIDFLNAAITEAQQGKTISKLVM